ncbi:hypothetical protein [Propionivibrio dicarboxylicus]|uniref:Uncharacterized protein n=1 Tax=Propionivibrio dicarboxylicus TaxID=83767 RepID=A0A1G8DD62_9RHOO|nr:hypothetical protein [Propionivibrio dicarboxylicus]SDH55647.1 hypothetical protein SAMN05660652_01896 [Propionivibrio dicarboxylicus]
MMYSTTTSRRIIKAKVKKSRTSQRNVRTTPHAAPVRTEAPALPRFSRTDTPSPKASQRPWYLSWKLLVPIVLCSSAAIAYAFVASSEDETEPSMAQEQAPQREWRNVRTETPGQARPMGYSGHPGQWSASHANGITGARPAAIQGSPELGLTASPARKQNTVATVATVASVASDVDTIEASFGENRRVTLPENVSGRCKLTQPGLRDLSTCLAQNGARAD